MHGTKSRCISERGFHKKLSIETFMEQIKLGVIEREKFVYWNVLLKQRFFLEFSDNQESNAKIEINEFSIEV